MGITTRSKAKLAPDQWTVVPLPEKVLSLWLTAESLILNRQSCYLLRITYYFHSMLQILALLADALVEIQEQVLADDEEVVIVLVLSCSCFTYDRA